MIGWWVLGLAAAVPLYAYVGYPVLLALTARVAPRRRRAVQAADTEWPMLTITIPAYNEERVIGETLNAILAMDYPPERRHVLVVSDASTDRTDEIVRSYADRGVELLRLPQRGGKTAAENAAREHIRGEILVNTDASVRLHPASLKPLIRAFRDPSTGVASGRDVSIARDGDAENVGESGYVGYEMWLRDLETRAGGIVGASGCYYASRLALHMTIVPEALSRDFAAPLIARENGFRAVSVHEAICFVPRARSLKREYRRKVRTMTRGLETLYYKRALLNPFRYGRFAWMLMSHKLIRWLVPWAMVAGLVGLILVAREAAWARWPLAAAGLGLAITVLGLLWPKRAGAMPRVIAAPTYLILGTIAGLHSWLNALRGEMNPVWEPTRRD